MLYNKPKAETGNQPNPNQQLIDVSRTEVGTKLPPTTNQLSFSYVNHKYCT